MNSGVVVRAAAKHINSYFSLYPGQMFIFASSQTAPVQDEDLNGRYRSNERGQFVSELLSQQMFHLQTP